MKSAKMPNPIDLGGMKYQANGNVKARNKSVLLPVMHVFLFFFYRIPKRCVKIKEKNFFTNKYNEVILEIITN